MFVRDCCCSRGNCGRYQSFVGADGDRRDTVRRRTHHRMPLYHRRLCTAGYLRGNLRRSLRSDGSNTGASRRSDNANNGGARLLQICNCVDLNRFMPAPSSRTVFAQYGIANAAKHFIVMSLGRLAGAAAHKDFDRLIGVVVGLAHRFPALRLVTAGRGDDRERLETLAAKRGISGLVTFTGAVHEDDLADVYRAAHVFSLVSDRGHGRGEGIPLAPLEAMGCGLPIIVGDEDGSREAVVDGRNGLVVTPRDPEAHANALCRLIESEQARTLVATGAVQVARERYSYSSFVQKHRKLLEPYCDAAKRHENDLVS